MGDIFIKGEDISFGQVIFNAIKAGALAVLFVGIFHGISKALGPAFKNLKAAFKKVIGEGDRNTKLDIKPKVENQKMQNIVDNLYKGQANPKKVGNGTTMDAVRHEIKTGGTTHGLTHTTKAKESINGLKKLIKKGLLNDKDKAIAEALIEDLTNALNGK